MNKVDKKLDAIQKAIIAIKKNMANKDDIKNMATKHDFKGMATKDDLKNLGGSLRDEMKQMKVRLVERIDEAQMEIIATVDRHKADGAPSNSGDIHRSISIH